MRLVTTLNGFAALVALAAVTIALPVVGSGCGRTACFVYSQNEHAAHGMCPGQAKALVNFTDPHCPGPVLSVDGAGIFSLNNSNPDQSLCCYPVTQQDLEQTFANGCTPPTGAGGAGGFSSTAQDMTSTGFAGGVTTGGGGCVSCGQKLGSLGADPGLLCPQSSGPWSTLETCICGGSGSCTAPCKLNLCMSSPMSKECFACIQDPMMASGCSSELSNCQNN